RHSIGYMQRRSCHFLAARPIASSGSAPAATPLTDRGGKPQATAAGCHFGEILPQGATLMMALSVSFSRNWRERSTDPRTGKGAYRGMVTGPGGERQTNDS